MIIEPTGWTGTVTGYISYGGSVTRTTTHYYDATWPIITINPWQSSWAGSWTVKQIALPKNWRWFHRFWRLGKTVPALVGRLAGIVQLHRHQERCSPHEARKFKRKRWLHALKSGINPSS
jgi:hypothetical protein